MDDTGTPHASSEAPTRSAVISAVVLATLIGAVVRAVHVLLVDFPLNDGALFLTMTRDLVGNGFALPVTTSYNGADIPFVYPPLGFYVAGVVSLAGLDLFTVFRLVPLIISVATIPAAYLLASVALPTRMAALIATVIYALIPRTLGWTIAGGGVTRGLGVLFVILVLWAAIRLERSPSRGRCVTLGILAALAALSHPEAVLVGGFWLLGILVTSSERRRTFGWFLGAAGVALLALLPWLIAILPTHGVEALLGAGSSGFDYEAGLQYILTFQMTGEPWIAPIAVLALIGLFMRCRERDWRWLLWTAVIVVDPRGGGTYVAPILAMLASIAVVEAVLPALHWRPPARDLPWPDASIGRAPYLTLAILLLAMAAGAIGARSTELTPLFGLPSPTRDAIARVGTDTEPDARVIVASGTAWSVDAVAEWFPLLADRTSVSTVQGAEWLGVDGWNRALDAHLTLQACAFDSVECFDTWLATNAPDATHLFMPRGAPTISPLESECCPALRAPLIAAGYDVVFDDPGGTLLAVP